MVLVLTVFPPVDFRPVILLSALWRRVKPVDHRLIAQRGRRRTAFPGFRRSWHFRLKGGDRVPGGRQFPAVRLFPVKIRSVLQQLGHRRCTYCSVVSIWGEIRRLPIGGGKEADTGPVSPVVRAHDRWTAARTPSTPAARAASDASIVYRVPFSPGRE